MDYQKEPQAPASGWNDDPIDRPATVAPAVRKALTLRLGASGIGGHESTNIWLNPELEHHQATAHLDRQKPSTLYYLGRVKNVEGVCKVYVEHIESGAVKHWTVLEERDYDAMDTIYDIEQDTIERFPAADLSFRVTVWTEGGPSISNNATKIFDSK